ncbi:MAG: hypothetical protein E6Q97_19630 [Desulfurellales bacterium]|nr:MAG: hypothetical protein E6Q97_19630 [Desulfurellales bacterium]
MADKKRYRCLLPTNGAQVGDIVEMTEAEAANANGGEAEPRFVLEEGYVAQDTNVPQTAAVDETPTAPATDAPAGGVTDDAPQA